MKEESKEDVKAEQETQKIDTPNLLEHGGVSRETLAKLGVKIKGLKMEEPVSEETTEKQIANKSISDVEESDEDSPLHSILKKPMPLKRLETEAFEESRVEISPGLFTKRPSKSLEKEKIPKSEIPLDLEQSPQLPQLKTVDLKSLMGEKKNDKLHEDKNNTPELPEFKTNEVQLWSTQKKSNPRPKFRPVNSAVQLPQQAAITPELPSFQSQGRPKTNLGQDKENDEPVIPNKSQCDTPELPDLKTINLATLLQKSKGTVL